MLYGSFKQDTVWLTSFINHNMLIDLVNQIPLLKQLTSLSRIFKSLPESHPFQFTTTEKQIKCLYTKFL